MRLTIIALDGTAKTAVEAALSSVFGETCTMITEQSYSDANTFTATGRYICDIQISEAQESSLRSHATALAAVNMKFCLRNDSESAASQSQTLVSTIDASKFQVYGSLDSGVASFWATALAEEAEPEEGDGDILPG